MASYIDTTKDKSGMVKSILRIPYWSRQEPQPPVDVDYYYSSGCSSLSSSELAVPPPPPLDRGKADGGAAAAVGGGSHLLYSDGCTSPDLLSRSTTVGSYRGTADGGFTDRDDDEDDTTVARVNGGGDSSSDFDDFSDGDEQVNIIAVVNGTDDTHTAASTNTPDLTDSTLYATPKKLNHADPNSSPSQENEVSEIYFAEKTAAPASSSTTDDSGVSSSTVAIGRCTAIYDYSANMYDELTIRVGDEIAVHEKQEDGWWLGELRGTMGIFPATYVEEHTSSA